MLFTILSTCKGGGYHYCRTNPPHPKRNTQGLYPLHRVVLENKLGRLLEADECAHHINGDKYDNRAENLTVMLNKEHSKYHRKACKRSVVESSCGLCGKVITLDSCEFKRRLRDNKYGGVFCSIQCSGKFSRRPRNLRKS